MTLPRRLLAEFIGTAALLATIVGSGVMGAQLARGNEAIALLANAAATGAMLYVLVAVLGPLSGAHLNPAVSLASRLRGTLSTREALAYALVQIAAAVGGVVLAHAMFGLPLVQASTHMRTGFAQWLSEGVATTGLVLTILLGARGAPTRTPALVSLYIFAAYWFTASTSFANPAVTLARALSDTFAGIRAVDVAPFVLAQISGAVLASLIEPLLADSSTGKPIHSEAANRTDLRCECERSGVSVEQPC